MSSVKLLTPESVSETVEESINLGRMGQPHLFSNEELSKMGIINPMLEDQSVVNAYRDLRTSIITKIGKGPYSIMVSSVTKGGGASFTAMNLATSFIFDQHKTALLIDCNFKNPTLANSLQVDYQYGLKHYLTGEVDDVKKVIHPTGIPRLRLVPAGLIESDLVEFFTSQKMYMFLHEVKNRYPDRVIILDAPPVLESADSKILAELCDAALLVVKYKGVMPGAIKKTVSAIDKSKVVGIVLNN